MEKDKMALLLLEKSNLVSEKDNLKADMSSCKSTVANLVTQVSEALSTTKQTTIPDDKNNDLHSLCDQLKAAVKSLNDLEGKYSAFETKLDQFTNVLKSMSSTMNDTLNDVKQYPKINNLLVHKMSYVPLDYNEFQFTNWICYQLNNLLPNLTCKLNYSHIEAAHPMHDKKDGSSPVVIIRFKYRANRNDVFKNKKDLKGSPVKITEHLIPERLALLKRVQNYIPVRNTWTLKGNVFAIVNGHKRQIKNNEEWVKMVNEHELTELPKTDSTIKKVPRRRGTNNRPPGQSQMPPYGLNSNSHINFDMTYAPQPSQQTNNAWVHYQGPQAQIPYYNSELDVPSGSNK